MPKILLPPEVSRDIREALRNLNKVDADLLGQALQRACEHAYLQGFDHATQAAKRVVAAITPDSKET